MPPRLRLPSQHLCGFLPVRENCSGVSLVLLPQARLFSRDSTVRPSRLLPSQRRRFADSSTDRPASGPNQDVLPHVSEEAATTSEIMGEDGPDIGQGTPVQEVLQRDRAGQEKAPEVMKQDLPEAVEELKKAAARFQIESSGATPERLMELLRIRREGLKFGSPDLSLAQNVRNRYDAVVKQVTRLMMRDGKLAAAERNMSLVLSHLRASPAPATNPSRPLITGSPPADRLPLDPIRYLTVAIDSVAPLFRIRSLRGAAGGGMALQMPTPLALRQRRRTATMWIIDAASKKPSRGSGPAQFAHRIAEEIIAVVEGRSSIWEKRNAIHKLGVSARANLSQRSRKK